MRIFARVGSPPLELIHRDPRILVDGRRTVLALDGNVRIRTSRVESRPLGSPGYWLAQVWESPLRFSKSFAQMLIETWHDWETGDQYDASWLGACSWKVWYVGVGEIWGVEKLDGVVEPQDTRGATTVVN